uniref:Uncharacterized protein n=1 Tax=Lotharella globosa TaxID=91324 RepID=A0A7S3Z1Y6_9EUKA|mmetsp:Transcript_9079/g.17763  ORF Transcript_9079/g.17763 Transcript_9079/m.17763 type:complete len:403 (+) Transcript_9079:1522-2730(+)|eukprot:CAMPEP_0167818984 /NCGR_PEP_ID=MMETSP0112_2-20121227/5136_1 /TAXON_ID=91324 /ORGANISM="Lotharella globosa, Strain CCCM811" /LENGTH=402 /DNA_ID=CAMNT_0007719085 /DNA_START=1428 /DNA_END=2636 /DNA_ORIENTATION=+
MSSTVKGLLLCNRPNDVDPRPVPTRASKTPFISAVQQKQVESKRLDISKAKNALKERNKDKLKNARPTAQDRHQEWLQKLIQKKEHIKAEAEWFRKTKEEEKAKFMERSTLLRSLLRQGNWKESHVHGSKKAQARKIGKTLGSPNHTLKNMREEAKAEAQKTEAPAVSPSPSKPIVESKTSSNATKALKNRPSWALTKEQNEARASAEEDELLDFAMSLDYQRFIDDLDIRDALEFVKKRVTELDGETAKIEEEEEKKEKEIKQAERAERAAEVAVDRAEVAGEQNQVVHDGKAKVAIPRSPEVTTPGRDEAQHALDTHKGLKQVHSKASIKAVIEKERQKQIAMRSTMKLEQRWGGHGEETKSDDAMARVSTSKKPPITKPTLEDQNKVQNLPYMYRHPAI